MRFALLALICLNVTTSGGCIETINNKPEPFQSPPDRIILIVIDTLRRDHLGIYGADLSTPVIDSLAQRGQAFDRASSAFSSTTMSMGALLTGRTPSLETGRRAKALDWNSRAWCGLARFFEMSASTQANTPTCVPRSIDTLAGNLQAVGYATLGVVSNVLLYEPTGFARGFDSWLEVGARTDEEPEEFDREPRHLRGAYGGTLANSVNAGVRDLLRERTSDHFFLYVHYMDAHDFEELEISYGEAVMRADRGVGDLLDQLAEEKLLDRSQIIVTSDHGERFAERHPVPGTLRHFGNPSFEYLVNIPFIVSPPLAGNPHRILRGQDVMELILDLAGAPVKPRTDLREGEMYYSEQQWQTYREGRWKAMFKRTSKRALLFDLENDPLEQIDVSRRFPDVMMKFRKRVAQITRSTATRPIPSREITEEERARLRALGYLESLNESAD